MAAITQAEMLKSLRKSLVGDRQTLTSAAAANGYDIEWMRKFVDVQGCIKAIDDAITEEKALGGRGVKPMGVNRL